MIGRDRGRGSDRTDSDAMATRLFGAVLTAALTITLAAPAAAANKEHQQLAADIRMLQEQTQQLQVMLSAVTEAIKAVNTRLDDQNNAMRKAFADEKLVIDNLSNDLRVVREKVDDNNVRISSLTQELDALRQAMQQLSARPTTTDQSPATGTAPGTVPPESGAAAAPPPSTAPVVTVPTTPPVVAPGTSPQKLFDQAYADYASGQWDLAVDGFQAYIRNFPRSELASEAQVKIGQSYQMAGNNQKAIEAFDTAIRGYPASKIVPEAYYRKGLALQAMKQVDAAREAFQFAADRFPDSDAGRMAKQRLDQMKPPERN